MTRQLKAALIWSNRSIATAHWPPAGNRHLRLAQYSTLPLRIWPFSMALMTALPKTTSVCKPHMKEGWSGSTSPGRESPALATKLRLDVQSRPRNRCRRDVEGWVRFLGHRPPIPSSLHRARQGTVPPERTFLRHSPHRPTSIKCDKLCCRHCPTILHRGIPRDKTEEQPCRMCNRGADTTTLCKRAWEAGHVIKSVSIVTSVARGCADNCGTREAAHLQ